MKEFSKYVGLDTHKDTIAVAEACGGKPRYYGEIPNTAEAVGKLVKKLSPDGEVVSFCYEAGPCGYGIYRQIKELRHDCVVVAPSLIPTKPGDRVKTDRRDGESLARLHRAGELTAVWVPDQEQEAIRDLTRAREDMKSMERRARQRLNAFLLRHGKIYASGRSKWTQHVGWAKERSDVPIRIQRYDDGHGPSGLCPSYGFFATIGFLQHPLEGSKGTGVGVVKP